ncbi:MAG: gamma-glutamylcyclotransferase [Oscillospiraceae bacterium]|nr:gamma-glutamylcyclotransferase [Oscillospiraceae bacterium]
MKLYIAYGSNTNHELMASRCPDAEFISKVTIKNYRLEFHGTENNSYLTIVPDENSNIETAVWMISEADETLLDNYEGFPKLYRKEMLDIIINGTVRQALVYIMNDGLEKALPSEPYFNCVLDGYVDCNINTEQLFNAMFDAKTAIS